MFAADAVARLSGTVGVAAVTAGPGMYVSIYKCLIAIQNSTLPETHNSDLWTRSEKSFLWDDGLINMR